jgi:hypothetical protein
VATTTGLDMYGYRFLLGDEPSSPTSGSWPAVTVRVSTGTECSAARRADVGFESAHLEFETLRVDVRRSDRTIDVTAGWTLSHEELLHPYLAFPAAVFNHWDGHSTLHAGGIIGERGAVLLLGQKGAGKSSLLGAAASADHAVLCDDLAVLRDGQVLAGPRCIDLRPDVAASLGGRPLGVIGARERHRIDLPPVPSATPVVALVRLLVGPEVRVDATRHRDAAAALFESFALGFGPGRAEHVFDLLEIPMWDLQRPLELGCLDDALSAVVKCAR